MKYETIQIPFDYAVIGCKTRKGRLQRFVSRAMASAEIPAYPSEAVEARFDHDENRYHSKKAAVVDRRIWYPVHLRNDMALGQVEEHPVYRKFYAQTIERTLSEAGLGLAEDNPFSIDELTHSTARVRARYRKSFVPSAELEATLALQMESDHDRSRQTALRDAEDMCFIGGILHGARREPTISVSDRGQYVKRQDLRRAHVEARSDPPHFRADHAAELRDILSLPDTNDTTDGLKPVIPLVDFRFRDFDFNLVDAIKSNILAVIPHAGNTSLIGSGDFGSIEFPEYLEESLFDGRSLLRDLVVIVEEEGDIGPMVEPSLAWLDSHCDAALRAGEFEKMQKFPLGTITGGSALSRTWWDRFERDRRNAPAPAPVAEEDLDALEGLRF